MSRALGPRALLAACALLCAVLAGCVRGGESAQPASRAFAWTAALVVPGRGEPAVGEGAVFVAGDVGVAAYDQRDGALRWRNPAPHTSGTRLVYRAGRVFVAGPSMVRAYEAASGATLWEVPSAPDASPDWAAALANEAALYVGTRDHRVLALDQTSGKVLWATHIDEPGWVRGGGPTGITASGDTLYVSATRALTENLYLVSTVLVALDRGTGRILWRWESEHRRTQPHGAPVLAGKLLVTGGAAEGPLLAVDRFTGRQVWARQLYGYMWGTPVLNGGTLYVVTQAARAYALDPASGAVRWDRALAAGASYASVCGRELMVADYHLDALAPATGGRTRRLLQATEEEFVASGVAVADSTAFAAGQHTLYAMRCRPPRT